jgi:hypothetical protein
VLALRSRDSAGARHFLQRFWQTRSLAGTDLQISSYRGMGLISGRGALLGQDPQPLATALINDDLVLIASGRGVLEQSLDVSQIDELNQAASPTLQQAVARLDHGVALLTARSEAMQPWLGLPLPADDDQPELLELVAALQPAGRSLQVDALAQLRTPLPSSPGASATASAAPFLEALGQPARSLALLSRPAALLEEAAAAEQVDPWRALLGPPLQQALSQAGGPLPALVAAADDGPLLWASQPGGWLLGTPPAPALLDAVNEGLAQQGYSASPLDSQGQTLQAWTRLQSHPVRGNPDQLQAELGGARASEGDWAWWGQGLAVLNEQHEGRQPPQERLDQLEALATPGAPFQWAMDAGIAQNLMATWMPWRLLTTLSSTPLAPVVDGAALSLEPEAGQPRLLHLRGRLQLRG